jgi:hypothetical protein
MRIQNAFLVLIFLVLPFSVSSQGGANKIDLIQGVWANNRNNETEYSFKIIDGIRSLGISYTNDLKRFDFYFVESLEGFQNKTYNESDSININSFEVNGEYFTTVLYPNEVSVDGWVKIADCMVASYFECDGLNMSINGGKLVEFHKIVSLPQAALQKVFDQGRRDRRNYISEYLHIEVREVFRNRTKLYLGPGGEFAKYLPAQLLVTVLEKKRQWIKIQFESNNVVEQGWIMERSLR